MMRLVVTFTTAMAAMHEQVHHQAATDQKPWQGGDGVRLMLGPEEISGDAKKSEQHQSGSG